MILVINIHHGDGVFSLLNQELKYMEFYMKSSYGNFPNLFALGLFHIFPLQSFQSLLAVLNKLHQFLHH